MKRVAVTALLVGFIGSSAMAGTIGLGSGGMTIDRGAGDAEVFDISVVVDATSVATFNAADIVVGTDAGDILSGFQWDVSVPRVGFESITDNSGFGGYADDIKIGWFNPFGTLQAGAVLGTITVDLTGLADGDYSVDVDSVRDGGASKLTSGTNVDPATGSLAISIVPEPATLALLGIGGLATAMRRRRNA